MERTQNNKKRAVFTLTLLALFELFRYSSKFPREFIFYSLFLLLIFSYYIFDIFSFNKKYRYQELIISLILNSFVFLFLGIYYDAPLLIGEVLFYTFAQNTLKFLYTLIFNSKHRIIFLTNKVENRFLDAVKKNEKLYLENCIEPNEIYKIKNIEPNEVVYPTELTSNIVNEIFDLRMSGINVIDSMLFLEEVEEKIDVDSLSKDWIIKNKGFKILNSGFNQRIKRVMDIIMSITLLVVGFPFMILTYVLVKLDDPRNFFKNPAFFKQKRIGLGGKEFEIIKFRSMKIHNSKEFSKYTTTKDSRITKLGKFIRKTRLDEFPQALNILKGDMSFIGPRPEWTELGREYEQKINLYKVRYTIKPGLTGWAQVMYPYGGSLEDAKKKLEYDIYYIKHHSFVLDTIILFKTVRVVLFGKGL